MKKLIAVCGSDGEDTALSEHALRTAETVGRLIAKNNCILVCGGRGGIMEAACKGAKAEHGVTIGILPGSKDEANRFVDIAIPTYLGNMRNFLVVRSADVVIGIGGRWGTLNEISSAMNFEKPLILIEGTGGCVDLLVSGKIMQNIESTYCVAHSAEEAVTKALAFCKE